MRTCGGRDCELLRLVHGDLGGILAWPLRLHLARCAPCRARHLRLGALSRDLAGAMRNPVLGVRPLTPDPRLPMRPIGFLVALLLLLGGVVAADVAANRHLAAEPNLGPTPSLTNPAPACSPGSAGSVVHESGR